MFFWIFAKSKYLRFDKIYMKKYQSLWKIDTVWKYISWWIKWYLFGIISIDSFLDKPGRIETDWLRTKLKKNTYFETEGVDLFSRLLLACYVTTACFNLGLLVFMLTAFLVALQTPQK